MLERALDRLLAGRTTIIIAHRLATVRRADAILILEAGNVQEFGSYPQLANDPNSRFAQLLRTASLDTVDDLLPENEATANGAIENGTIEATSLQLQSQIPAEVVV